jgi:hypothetical protein
MNTQTQADTHKHMDRVKELRRLEPKKKKQTKSLPFKNENMDILVYRQENTGQSCPAGFFVRNKNI